MEINVNFLDNLRLEAKFDDFTVITDQPIRYKGDGSAPSPFDYFLASSAMCAAYFVKVYCKARDIPTDNIRLSQNNIVDPENRYNQIFRIQVELPEDISDKDRQGILRSIDRCTVKKVIQTGPEFQIEQVENLDEDAQAKLGCQRILIVDWDVHHGNGTQDIFWADPDVLFFDTHCAAPFYPGSGNLNEVGAGLGEGYTVNVPLPESAGDIAMEKAFRDILIPAADRFEPDLVLVSAGTDPHHNDMAFNLSYNGFAVLTSIVLGIAEKHCDGRLVLVLEGGYNLTSLARGVHTMLSVLAGGDVPELMECGLREVLEAAEFHRDAFEEE